MDLHDRYTNHGTTEIARIHDVMSNSSDAYWFDVAHSLIQTFNEDMKNASPNLDNLVTIRTLLCYKYQCSVKSREIQEQKRRNPWSFEDICITEVQRFLNTGNISHSKMHPVLLDIIVLQMTLYVETEHIIEKYITLRECIYINMIRDKEARLLNGKIIECFLNSLILKNHIMSGETQVDQMILSFEGDLKLWLSLKDDEERRQLASRLLKLINIAGPAKTLPQFWEIILTQFEVPSDALTAMCLMANICFPMEPCHYVGILHTQCTDERFWLILLSGLSSSIQQDRKQALYLIKRAVEFIDIYKCQIKSLLKKDYIELTPLVCSGDETMQESFLHVRRDFFLVLEVLEEKQKHLVTPVLPVVAHLLRGHVKHNDCNNCIHASWIRCVFGRILFHENNAIVKWGLLNALKLDLVMYDHGFLKLILEVLNNTFLYEQDANQVEPAVAKELHSLFIRAEENNADLINKFILQAAQISWGPIPIFYLTRTLSLMDGKVYKPWSTNELKAVKSLVEKHLTMHCRTLRTASQIGLIYALIHFTTECCDLSFLATTLSAFPTSEALTYPSELWTHVSLWISRIVKFQDVANFFDKICQEWSDENMQVNVSVKSFALMISLLYREDSMYNPRMILGRLLDYLRGADSRLYASSFPREKSIELMSCLTDFCNPTDHKSDIYHVVSIHVDAALKYMYKNLRKSSVLTTYDAVHKYATAIDKCVNNKHPAVLQTDLQNHIERFEKESLNILANSNTNNNVQRLFGLQILQVCLKSKNNQYKDWSYIEPLLLAYEKPMKSCDGEEIQSDSQNIKGKIASEYYKLTAELMYLYIKEVSVEQWIHGADWLKHLSHLLEIGGKEIITTIVAALIIIMKKKSLSATEVDEMKSILRVCWRSTFESRKTELFWLAMEQLIELLFSSSFLVYENTKELLEECMYEVLKEGYSVPGLNRMLLKGFEQMDADTMFDFREQLLACLLHGPVPRRDQRIEIQARSLIASNYELEHSQNFSILNTNTDSVTRAHAAVILHKLIATNHQYADSLLPLVIAKLEKDKNKRYFGDSLLHKCKHRIMQVLLMLQPVLNEESSTMLHNFMCEVIFSESNQASVRIMQEWLLIRLYLKYEKLLDKIWDLFEQGYEKRPGSLCSVVSIVFHISRLAPEELQENFITAAIAHIVPCCMAQQFNVRLYAQVVLDKLYELATTLKYKTAVERYDELYRAVSKSLQHGNLMKNSIKLREDFYFTAFHPEDDYSLQTLYYELPRLSNISADEWIPLKIFATLLFKENCNHPMKPVSSGFAMNVAQVSLHMLKSPAGGEPIADDIDNSIDNVNDIQKKIIPWKSMTPIEDDFYEISDDLSSRRKTLAERDGIIVVASLIDRPANLGGLSRTCEIFGAKELVIASLKYTEDKEFQSLSVSAERWLPITEVKPHLLPNYLMEKKNLGYTLVGAEQTAKSKNLLQMEFDKKTILLLGNEKEGIPANLIPLLDVCVEIPQIGVVRSLNVHVTGAICIWVYSKQHILS